MGFTKHRWNMAGMLRTSRIHRVKKSTKKNADPEQTAKFATEKAVELRENATPEELLILEKLLDLKIKHYFQKPFSSKRKCIIADFAFPRGKKPMLIVEIDGGYHKTDRQKEKDQKRTIWIHEHLGAEVLRFTNEEVSENAERVINKILSKLI